MRRAGGEQEAEQNLCHRGEHASIGVELPEQPDEKGDENQNKEGIKKLYLVGIEALQEFQDLAQPRNRAKALEETIDPWDR